MATLGSRKSAAPGARDGSAAAATAASLAEDVKGGGQPAKRARGDPQLTGSSPTEHAAAGGGSGAAAPSLPPSTDVATPGGAALRTAGAAAAGPWPAGDPRWRAAAESLSTNGYAVVDVMDEATRAQVLRDFQTSLQGFPEYRRSAEDPSKTPEGTPLIYVAGGFGALGG